MLAIAAPEPFGGIIQCPSAALWNAMTKMPAIRNRVPANSKIEAVSAESI